MAKKATTKKPKEEALEDILFSCRDSLRGRAALTDKRDMLLTLVFLKFISERYHDRCKEIREENADEPEYAEMLITQKRTAFGEKGVFMLSPETDWESLKLIAPKGLAGKQRLMPFFNRSNNEDLILAVQSAAEDATASAKTSQARNLRKVRRIYWSIVLMALMRLTPFILAVKSFHIEIAFHFLHQASYKSSESEVIGLPLS